MEPWVFYVVMGIRTSFRSSSAGDSTSPTRRTRACQTVPVSAAAKSRAAFWISTDSVMSNSSWHGDSSPITTTHAHE